ncbi:hypothetical protein KI387_044475, partial [Taxus chinensis]
QIHLNRVTAKLDNLSKGHLKPAYGAESGYGQQGSTQQETSAPPDYSQYGLQSKIMLYLK